MAKLRIFQSIENDIYVLRFVNDAEALSQQDKDLMQKYGEPEINLGGIFLEETDNEFTLPDEYVKVKSDFPVRKEFDSKQAPYDTETAAKVIAYRDEIKSRFQTAFTNLRANSDTFTGEQIYNI